MKFAEGSLQSVGREREDGGTPVTVRVDEEREWGSSCSGVEGGSSCSGVEGGGWWISLFFFCRQKEE